MRHAPESSVTDWVIDHPEVLKVFEKFGIDYSCGGKSLEYACREQGHDVRVVMTNLLHAIGSRRHESIAIEQ